MKWYKHETNAHNEESLVEVLHEFGLEGYGFWWLLQELVGKQMDGSDRCDLSYPLATWSRKLQTSKRKTSTFFEKFSEISLIILDFDAGNENNSVGKLKISIPNLLKSRDEYSKKSGQSPDKKPKVSGAKIEKEIESQIEIEIKEEEEGIPPPKEPVTAPVKPSRPRGNKLSDDEWMVQIRSNPAYTGIDIDRLKGKMEAWCMTKGKEPTRARLLNWLNREEKPMGVGNGRNGATGSSAESGKKAGAIGSLFDGTAKPSGFFAGDLKDRSDEW